MGERRLNREEGKKVRRILLLWWLNCHSLQTQAQLQAQSLAQAQAEAVAKAEVLDSSPPTHRKKVQSDTPVLEPVNLPPVHRHKALTQTTSAPFSDYDKLDDEDVDLVEPSECTDFIDMCNSE